MASESEWSSYLTRSELKHLQTQLLQAPSSTIKLTLAVIPDMLAIPRNKLLLKFLSADQYFSHTHPNCQRFKATRIKIDDLPAWSGYSQLCPGVRRQCDASRQKDFGLEANHLWIASPCLQVNLGIARQQGLVSQNWKRQKSLAQSAKTNTMHQIWFQEASQTTWQTGPFGNLSMWPQNVAPMVECLDITCFPAKDKHALSDWRTLASNQETVAETNLASQCHHVPTYLAWTHCKCHSSQESCCSDKGLGLLQQRDPPDKERCKNSAQRTRLCANTCNPKCFVKPTQSSGYTLGMSWWFANSISATPWTVQQWCRKSAMLYSFRS